MVKRKMKKHTVWACFVVNAIDSKQARRLVAKAIEPDTLREQDFFAAHRLKVAVFSNPAFDKLFEDLKVFHEDET